MAIRVTGAFMGLVTLPGSARLWLLPCGVAWDTVFEPMVEYIDSDLSFK